MTTPIGPVLLKTEMRELAKTYVTIQAAAIDSLVASTARDDEWFNIYQLSLVACDHIRETITTLLTVHHLLGRIP